MEAHLTFGTGKETMDAQAGSGITFHDFRATTIDGDVQEMSAYRGRLVLVVNIATQCTFTPQLMGLQQLRDQFREHGFEVLGFPSDQFHQDPGSDADAKEICSQNYEIDFPLFSKIDVNGPTAHPLWQWMCTQKAGVIGGRIAWNFTKFLIDGEGRVLRRYAPPVSPSRIARRIETDLGLR